MTPTAPAPVNRSGKVIVEKSGDRWMVELRLEEAEGGQSRRYTILLSRPFAAESAAKFTGEQVVADWKAGRTGVRDLMLAELAATYRKLRETQVKMQPPLVPTTRPTWERAIATWEELGWIKPEEAVHLRGHVRQTLAPESGGVQLRRLSLDAESNSAI